MRRTSADPQRAQQGATAAAAAPAALNSLSRLQHLADASPQVAQLRRLQALADGRFAPVAQLAGGPEEEELVQGKFSTAQRQPQPQQAPRANNTGMPDQLKSGIESVSGLSMDHVQVHYNSSQPGQLNALAYAQGSDTDLAPRHEHHLPHEAWQVVQQAQGRVRPTLQMKEGVLVNDDVGLEREADLMAPKALEGGHRVVEAHHFVSMPIETAQLIEGDATNSPDVNVANNHSALLANGPGSAQRGGNEMQRIADQRPEAALQRQVQAWGDGSERVGQLRAWQEVADGRGVGGKKQVLTTGFDARAAALARSTDRIHASPLMTAQRRQMAAAAPVQMRLVADGAVAGAYRVDDEGPYTLMAGSDTTHRVVAMTAGNGSVFHYDIESGNYVSNAQHQTFLAILAAYDNDKNVASDMYAMSEAMAQADAKAMVLWLATQPGAVRRFAYQHRATLDLPHANRVAITWFRFPAMFPSAASAAAVLAIPLINHDSAGLRDMLNTGKFASLAELTTVASWGNYTNLPNMKQIVTHAKVDTAARLVAWYGLVPGGTGAQLYAVLQNPKIQTAAELSTRLALYDLTQMAQWLGKAWVGQGAAGLTAINGRVPLASIIGTGTTAGQRYTADQASGASAGKVYHLSMSYTIDNPGRAAAAARYTGLHVSFRNNGAPDPSIGARVWYTVNAGQVAFNNTSGAFPAADRDGMLAEADTLVNRTLTSINCFW
jgi:hypothetical protein